MYKNLSFQTLIPFGSLCPLLSWQNRISHHRKICVQAKQNYNLNNHQFSYSEWVWIRVIVFNPKSWGSNSCRFVCLSVCPKWMVSRWSIYFASKCILSTFVSILFTIKYRWSSLFTMVVSTSPELSPLKMDQEKNRTTWSLVHSSVN
jgi:hypothetical protein